MNPSPAATRAAISSLAFLLSCGLVLCNARSPRALASETYYVDASRGSDNNPGTAEDKAWKSLDKVNGARFSPGDRLLFKAGTSYTGTLRLQGSGRQGAPIVVDRYGEGAKPRIDAEGKHPEALLLLNVEYWEVNNLELTNQGETREAGRFGVRSMVDDFGPARHVHLKNLSVHDVNSVLSDQGHPDGGVVVERRGGGIVWMTLNADGAKPSYFDDLVIEDCHLVRTDQDGIWGWAGYKGKSRGKADQRRHWHPNRNVAIRNNLLEDIGGSGMVPRCCVGCRVEGNTVRVAGTTPQCGVAGIYAWSCDETLVQFNEISGVQGYKNIDGMGYDSDFNCRNNLFQYNYSHDNAGGFMGVFAGGAGFTAELGNVGNQGTIIRYNVSRNDGRVSRAIVYHVAGGAKNAQIYNNTFFVGEGLDIRTFSESLSPEYHVRNNLFYVQGALSFSLPIQGTFSHNALFGKITDPPSNPDGLRVDPLLVAPGTGGAGRDSLGSYQLKPSSPCIGGQR